MANRKIGKLFSGRDGRRDWDEVEEDEEYEDEELDEEDEEEENRGKGKGTRLLSSVSSFLKSRRSDEDDEEDEDDEDEDDETPRGAGLKGLFSRKKAARKDEDYDYDDVEETLPVEEELLNFGEDAAVAEYSEEYIDEGYVQEDYVPQEYAEEEYLPVAQDFDPEAYAPEEQAYESEELFAPAEENAYAEEEDPFAALAYRAANPAADYAAVQEAEEEYPEEYPEEYAEEYDEEYMEEYTGEYEEAAPEYYEEDYSEDSAEEFEEDFDEQEIDGEYDDFDEEVKPVKKERAVSKAIFPVLCVLAICALGAIAFAVMTLLSCSAGKNAPAEKQESSKAEAVETVTPNPEEEAGDPTEGLTPAEIQAQGLATPNPDETLHSVKARLDEAGRIVPDEGGAVVPNRGKKLSLDDFSKSAMIGNSFVEGMNLWSDIESMKYICADGVSLDNMIGNYLYYVTVQNYDAIYLCLGLNEIGWSADTFISKYERVIDYIRSDATAKTRNAIIYIVSVMPVEEIMETVPGESGSTISKATIIEFNERLKSMCQEKGCWYLDVYSALANANGYLPESIAADDHVHFEKTGYRVWSDYLLTHYVDEGLLGD